MTPPLDEKRLEELRAKTGFFLTEGEIMELIDSYALALKVVRAAQSALFEYEEDKSYEHVRNAMTRLDMTLAPFSQKTE